MRAREVVWTNRLAVAEARRVADARPDLTIFNIPAWAFPHFSMLTASETPGALAGKGKRLRPELHPDAARNFDEKGRVLLAAVAPEAEQGPSQPPTDMFRPRGRSA